MSDIVIRVENLGKKYIIGHRAERVRYMALRDVLMQNAHSFWRKTKDLVQGKPIIQGDTMEEVWALKDVSFEVKRGEAVGIIGRNGAGKSTLLKILSRITEPTSGRIEITGRVASLLEVGTGFHPELTGRENIYLNGAILGMTRREIKAKFDEIVVFAEVEKFLDTPVKRFSSGMYVRLAFAIAAHLEPEILVIDEVLAVGDAQFQKKCLGKMEEVSKGGRTVLFVSHNMAAISKLCECCFLLDQGHIVATGESQNVISRYLNAIYPFEAVREFPPDPMKVVQIRRVSLLDHDGQPSVDLDLQQPFRVVMAFEARQRVSGVNLGVALEKPDGTPVCHSLHMDSLRDELSCEAGSYVAHVEFPGGVFNSGQYVIRVGIGMATISLDHQEAFSFQLNDLGTFAAMNPNTKPRPGLLLLRLPWQIKQGGLLTTL